MYNQREREGASEWIAIPDGRTAYKAKEQKRQEEDICIRNTKTARTAKVSPLT